MTLMSGAGAGIAFFRSFSQRRDVSMPNALLLSVIIVAYKSQDEIEACLASLPRELSGGAVEMLVVNNSPGDGLKTVVGSHFPWVKVIEPAMNLGFGRANNLGYAEADPQSEFVLFLNPDTVSNRHAFEHCIVRMREDERIGLISPKLILPDGSMDMACRRSIPTLWDGFCRASGLAAAFPRTALFSGYNLTHLPDDESHEVGAINGAFMLTPRRVLRAVAPDGRVFDETFFMYGDDLDLCIRVNRGGWKIIYDGRVAITHVKGVSVAKDFERMSRAIFDANRDVYLKHFNAGNSRLVEWKYRAAFGLWKTIALLGGKVRGPRRVRPI